MDTGALGSPWYSVDQWDEFYRVAFHRCVPGGPHVLEPLTPCQLLGLRKMLLLTAVVLMHEGDLESLESPLLSHSSCQVLNKPEVCHEGCVRGARNLV